MSESQLLWKPSEEFIKDSRLHHYREWLKEVYSLTFDDYHSLWQWSTDNIGDFWQSIWEYFRVIDHGSYTSIFQGEMPDTQWFRGARINYSEHIFRNSDSERPAIIFQSERTPLQTVTWTELTDRVGRLRSYLVSIGVEKGDCVCAYIPNIPEATFGFLAANAIGAVWSSCSPDFGAESVIDRFQQIRPKVMLCADGYTYGGKHFDKREVITQIVTKLPTLERIIFIPYLDESTDPPVGQDYVVWNEALSATPQPIEFEAVPFDHPMWVLYSSGTTGAPKAITHSHGGMLLEHLKYLAFHNDLHPGERFFWFSTTGWMMWNYVQASLLHGGTIVLYDGSPGYPDLNVLWRLAADARIDHFGTSAPFLVACMKQGLDPSANLDLRHVRSVSSTGAPLPPEAFDWVYEYIHSDVWLCSMSGGTDVCTAFVGGCPELPVYRGEIQCRALGVSLYAFDEAGEPVTDGLGEMVITKPMPSMPVYFWNDPGKRRYRSSYFDMFPGIWRHGDWVKITPRGGLVIYGRSDATLNRQGVRIGTAEIYRVLNGMEELKDALIVHLDEDDFMPLFVVVKEGYELTGELRSQIKKSLRSQCSPRHVPDKIYRIEEVPYTISGKKMEAPVKNILSGKPVDNSLSKDAMRNPEAMDYFVRFGKS